MIEHNSIDNLVSNILGELENNEVDFNPSKQEEPNNKVSEKVKEIEESEEEIRKREYVDRISQKTKDEFGNLYQKPTEVIEAEKRAAEEEMKKAQKPKATQTTQKTQTVGTQTVTTKKDSSIERLKQDYNISKSNTPNSLQQNTEQNKTEYINFYEINKNKETDTHFVKEYDYLFKKMLRALKVNFIRAGNIFRLKGSFVEVIFGLLFLLIPVLLANVLTLFSILIVLLLLLIGFLPNLFSKKVLLPAANGIKSTTTKFWRKFKNTLKGGNIFKILIQSPFFSVVMIGGLMYICVRGAMLPLNSIYDIGKVLASITEKTFSLVRSTLSIPAKIATKKFEKRKEVSHTQTQGSTQNSALIGNRKRTINREPTKRVGFLKDLLSKLFTTRVKERGLTKDVLNNNAIKKITDILKANARDRMNLLAKIRNLERNALLAQKQENKQPVYLKGTETSKSKQTMELGANSKNTQFILKENFNIRDKLNNYDKKEVESVKAASELLKMREDEMMFSRQSPQVAEHGIKERSEQKQTNETGNVQPTVKIEVVHSTSNELSQRITPDTSKPREQKQEESLLSNRKENSTENNGSPVKDIDRGNITSAINALNELNENKSDKGENQTVISKTEINEYNREDNEKSAVETKYDEMMKQYQHSNSIEEKGAEDKLRNMFCTPEEITKLVDYKGQDDLRGALMGLVANNKLTENNWVEFADAIATERDSDETAKDFMKHMDEWKRNNPDKLNDERAVNEGQLEAAHKVLEDQEQEFKLRYGEDMKDLFQKNGIGDNTSDEEFKAKAQNMAIELASKIENEEERLVTQVQILKDFEERNRAFREKEHFKDIAQSHNQEKQQDSFVQKIQERRQNNQDLSNVRGAV
ncbi:MAG: hypothetical protein LBH46_00020 [Rickettsiales bacterium]|nr:hypothetical protein [Rickettsiales bacterium]